MQPVYMEQPRPMQGGPFPAGNPAEGPADFRGHLPWEYLGETQRPAASLLSSGKCPQW